MQVMERVRLIEALDDLDSIWGEFLPLANELGFDYVIYTLSNSNNDVYYYDNLGLHSETGDSFYDSFLEFCCNSYDTMFTGSEFLETHVDLNLPVKAYDLIQRAARLGMISGIGIPLRLVGSNRYGGFNLGSRLKRPAFEALCDEVQGSAQVACMLVHRHIETVLNRQRILMAEPLNIARARGLEDLNEPALTPREKDILVKIANGYSRKKCAKTLCLSESTVSTHIKSIYRKLGVHNRVQAANAMMLSET